MKHATSHSQLPHYSGPYSTPTRMAISFQLENAHSKSLAASNELTLLSSELEENLELTSLR